MPTVSRTFTVGAPSEQVLEFLRDFTNAEQWDPGTETCTRLDSGPVRVGSRWHNVSKVLGRTTELEYRLKEANGPLLVFEGHNDAATSIDTIVVTPAEAGSRISYKAQLKMHGLAVLMAPAMKLLFEKIAGDTETRMTTVLNSLTA